MIGKMAVSTIGMELELLLIDKNGYVRNNASEILNDPKIKEEGGFTYEGTKAQIEINSAPAVTVDELYKGMQKKLILLEEVCQNYNSFPVPISETGAGQGEWIKHPKIDAYKKIIGKEALNSLLPYSGIHIHISQKPGKELGQYYLIQALEPLASAVTSTSPISHQGINRINCYRVNNQRNIAFKKFPLHAPLLDYPLSLDEIKDRDRRRYGQWREAALREGIPNEKYEKTFKPETTGYHSIRKRDQIGPGGTWEFRSLDTCTPDIYSAFLALFKGMHDYAVGRDIPINIAGKIGEFSFTDKQIILPTFETNKKFYQEVIEDGIKPDQVHDLTSQILTFAEQGLPQIDKQYLQPIKEMLKTRMNPADHIMQYMKSLGCTGRQYSSEQSAQANIFMRNWHQKNLKDYQTH